MFYNYGGWYLAPPFVNNQPNASMDYWTRSLFQRLTALIDFENLPKGEAKQYEWDKDAFKYGLFMLGFLAVIESKSYGIIPQPAAITGFGLQAQPTGVIISTPYIQTETPLMLGRQAELIKLTPDYFGVYDIITKYAAELKEIDTSIKSAARNSRLAYALIASDDKSARTLKTIREKVINGDDVIIDEKILKDKTDPSKLPWHEFDRDLKNSYILSDLIADRRATLIDFYREIGVRTLDDKRERMINAEVAAGNAETFIRSEVWIETLKESCEKVNKLFGTKIKPVINRPDTPNDTVEAESGVLNNVRE